LAEFVVLYDELPLTPTGEVDGARLEVSLVVPTRLVLVQRSFGYSWRPSLSVAQIVWQVERVKALQPDWACCRHTAPGISSEGGTSFDCNRLLFQGLFLAPPNCCGRSAGVFQACSPEGAYLDPVPAPMAG